MCLRHGGGGNISQPWCLCMNKWASKDKRKPTSWFVSFSAILILYFLFIPVHDQNALLLETLSTTGPSYFLLYIQYLQEGRILAKPMRSNGIHF